MVDGTSGTKWAMAEKAKKTGELVIIRHGQSQANLDNVFAGWAETPLTTEGKRQAEAAGDKLRKDGFVPDVVFSSTLERAIDTTKIALNSMGLTVSDDTIIKDPALLERHYGGLTGMDKAKAEEEFGKDKFLEYRRSFDVPPPAMDESHSCHPDNPSQGLKVIGMPPNGEGTESLSDVVDRVKPFLEKEILPRMAKGEKVLIGAHGNSLRALSMLIEGMTPDEVKGYEIANGVPIKYKISVPQKSTTEQPTWTFEKSIMTGQGSGIVS
jgi:2,3-bisphosphoglycerate-dependent phosphoglycerate mutase